MSKLFDLLDPTSWLFRGIAAIIIAGAMWWAWTGFKAWVSAPAVAAALKEERSKTEPIFKELTANFNALQGTFENITTASNAERAKRKAEIEVKIKDLNYALTQNKTLKIDLANLRGANDDFERLLNTITANNNSSTGASASTRLKQLSNAHQQCERALRESDEDNAETLGRLDEALAVVRALKN
jgi:DNA anti-recombination protein RmuC